MKLGKTYFSGSLTFDEGTNTLGPNTSNITGSFSGSLKGTITATGNIIPAVSGAYDLGSTAFPFKDLYITQNSLKFIDDTTGSEIGRISVNSNTGDIKLLNTKNLTDEQKASLTAENVGAEALSPVSASSLWVSQSISPGHTNTTLGHTNQKFHTLHTQYVSASSAHLDGDLKVGGKVTAQEFHTEFVSASIIYQSGSTKFGDTADDTHEFTGSAFIEPGLTVTGNGSNHIIKAVRAGNTRLFVGNAVNTVGINTETVNNPLTVNGGADFSGNVGIGTTTPASGRNLHIANSTTGVLRVEGTSTNGEAVVELYGKNSSGTQRTFGVKYDNADIFRIGTGQAVPIRFETSDTERLRIDGGGNVGIGTTSPSAPLHVYKTADYSAIISRADWNSGTPTKLALGKQFGPLAFISTDLVETTNDTSYIALNYKSGLSTYAEGLRVYNNGYVGIGTTLPVSILHITRASAGNTMQSAPSIIFSNRDSTSGTFIGGGIFNNPYRDVSTSSVTSGIWFENQNSADAGALAKASDIVFGSNSYSADWSTPTERMRITNAGNVGINTTSPNSKLTIQSGGDATLFSVRGHLSGYSYPNIFEVVQTSADALVNVKTGAGTTITSLSGYSGTPSYFLSNVGIGTTTPVRKLDVVGPIISTRNELYSTATINSTTPYNSTIPYGWSRFYMEMPCDNGDRTVFSNINDSRVFMWIHFGDSPSRDMAHYSWMATSVPYGLASFSQLHYIDGGWNTGGFVVTRTSSGNNFTISIRVSSYYNSANTAYGDIYLLRVG